VRVREQVYDVWAWSFVSHIIKWLFLHHDEFILHQKLRSESNEIIFPQTQLKLFRSTTHFSNIHSTNTYPNLPNFSIPQHHQLKSTVNRFHHEYHIPKSILRLASTPYFRGKAPSLYLVIMSGGRIRIGRGGMVYRVLLWVSMAWVCDRTSVQGGRNKRNRPITVINTMTVTKTVHSCPEHM